MAKNGVNLRLEEKFIYRKKNFKIFQKIDELTSHFSVVSEKRQKW
jgi:hypothetical protein